MRPLRRDFISGNHQTREIENAIEVGIDRRLPGRHLDVLHRLLGARDTRVVKQADQPVGGARPQSEKPPPPALHPPRHRPLRYPRRTHPETVQWPLLSISRVSTRWPASASARAQASPMPEAPADISATGSSVMVRGYCSCQLATCLFGSTLPVEDSLRASVPAPQLETPR